MRAIVCRQYGEPELLELAEVPVPQFGDQELLVSVEAAGLNFADLVFLKGSYQGQAEAPFIPGIEVFGLVTSVGSQVSGFRPGDRVIGQVPAGGYAEYVAMNANTTIRMTIDVPAAEAAAFYANYGTAYSALVQRANARAGETVLVLGAAGGVGLAAVQIAKALGLRVIADCRGAAKQALVREQGAHLVADYQAGDFRDKILQFTDGRGCDIVLDMIGHQASKAALRVVGFCGRFVVIGFAAGEPYAFPGNHLLVKNASVVGHWWGDYSVRDRKQLDAAFEHLFAMYSAGQISPLVTEVLSLEQVPAGLRRYADRKVLSKLVALPSL